MVFRASNHCVCHSVDTIVDIFPERAPQVLVAQRLEKRGHQRNPQDLLLRLHGGKSSRDCQYSSPLSSKNDFASHSQRRLHEQAVPDRITRIPLRHGNARAHRLQRNPPLIERHHRLDARLQSHGSSRHHPDRSVELFLGKLLPLLGKELHETLPVDVWARIYWLVPLPVRLLQPN